MSEYVFRLDPYAARCAAAVIAADEQGVVLDRTVFYPTGGGQPGDRGVLALEDGAVLEVLEAVKGEDGVCVVHRIAGDTGPPAPGTQLSAEIDWERRYRLMRMHSALHLLCAAVACPVTGGQVGEGKGRLDFDLGGRQLDPDEVAARIARWIDDDRPIRERWIEAEELAQRPELVRTMSVKPPMNAGRVRLIEIEGVDLQACGGTHVRTTGEIGALRIGRIENKGRQNRRVNLVFDG